MQDRWSKTIAALVTQVAALLALSLPAITYADNFSRSSAGYRSSPGMASSHRGPGRSGGRHVTRDNRSNDSIEVRQSNNNGPSPRQENPGITTAGNQIPQGPPSRSADLDKRRGPPSSSRQGRYQGQRKVVVSDKPPVDSRHDRRPETITQLINNGRDQQFKPQKNPMALPSKQKKPVTLISQQEKPGVLTSQQQKPGGPISKHKKPVTLISQQQKPGISSSRHNNPRRPTPQPIKIDINKNQGQSEGFRTPGDRIQVATIRPDKNKGHNVVTKPMNSFQRPTNTGQNSDNLDNKGALFQTQYKKYNSNNKQRNRRNRNHRHHSHIIYYPYVFFSFHSLYYPYRYYPYRYTSYYYPYRYYPYRYTSYYYPYSYYSGYYAYNYPFYEPYGYSSPIYIDEEPVYSTDKPYGIESPGWSYLAQGDFQAAMNVFANDIQSYPNAGIPKVGYALSSAAAGHLSEGVLAMREAFDVDPDSIHYLVFDEEMLPIIDALIEAYEVEIQRRNKSPDETFMVATLHYLKYDYGSAHEAINRAIIDGDRNTSMGQLHRLVDEQFSNAYADKNN